MNHCSCEKIYPDVEYLKSMYPNSLIPLYQKIADVCDHLEYEGSLMFDEFPDHELVLQLINAIIDSFPEEMDANSGKSWFPELVTVMVLNEFLHRRIRKKEF